MSLTWGTHCALKETLKLLLLGTESSIEESYNFIASLLVPVTTPFVARGQLQNTWDHLFFLWFS